LLVKSGFSIYLKLVHNSYGIFRLRNLNFYYLSGLKGILMLERNTPRLTTHVVLGAYAEDCWYEEARIRLCYYPGHARGVRPNKDTPDELVTEIQNSFLTRLPVRCASFLRY